MNTIMSNLRTLAYVLVSAFALSVSTVDVANAQCRQYVYNQLVRIGDSVGGMDCVTAAGPNGVLGDVTLASGVFSRAGTLGLSATGSNVVTFSTNGSERARIDASGNFGIGTNNPTSTLTVSGDTSVSGTVYSGTGFNGYTVGTLGLASNFTVRTYSASYDILFRAGATELVRYKGNGNVLVGTTTDGNFRFDVGNSGSTGTARFYDQTATTGVTQVVVRAGAGQASTNLTTWQNNAGATLASVDSSGNITGAVLIGAWLYMGNSNQVLRSFQAGVINTNASLQVGSTALFAWASTTDYSSATRDLGLARNAAGIIEVNNGSAGTYRDIIARAPIWTAVSAATLANSQCTVHLASNTQLTFTCKGSDGTNRTNTLTLAP